MDTIGALANRVQNRLEEVVGPPGEFWLYYDEILPAIVEGMNEASLITGIVQQNNVVMTIPKLTTWITMPIGTIALVRIRNPQPVKKTELHSLDMMVPLWQSATPQQTMQAWFPVGLTMFGIFPQLIEDATVTLDYLSFPVNVPMPYTGNEPVPFQNEFNDGFEMYAAHALRFKEAGQEFEESQQEYQSYLDTMKQLSLFQGRRDTLVFSKSVGSRVGVNPTEVR